MEEALTHQNDVPQSKLTSGGKRSKSTRNKTAPKVSCWLRCCCCLPRPSRRQQQQYTVRSDLLPEDHREPATNGDGGDDKSTCTGEEENPPFSATGFMINPSFTGDLSGTFSAPYNYTCTVDLPALRGTEATETDYRYNTMLHALHAIIKQPYREN